MSVQYVNLIRAKSHLNPSFDFNQENNNEDSVFSFAHVTLFNHPVGSSGLYCHFFACVVWYCCHSESK